MTLPYDQVHAARFAKSLELLAPHIKQGTNVLELGGRTRFTTRLEQLGAIVAHSEGDLRYHGSLRSGWFDLVLCMEVIEHINDHEPAEGQIIDEWKQSGVNFLLTCAHDALKPGGLLFVTTPNACSITTIFKLLNHQPPMLWRPHIREYTVYELDEIVRKAGFSLTYRQTFDIWLNSISSYDHQRIAAWLLYNGHSVHHRGEDIMLFAQK
jgi:SAM-dependent methyltransferase